MAPWAVMLGRKVMWHATQERGIPMYVNIITNGLLLTPEVVDRMQPYGLNGIKITLDGDKDTHNRMRGARRYSAEILLAPGDRIILDDDSVTNLEARTNVLVPATLYSRLLASRPDAA